MVAEDGKMKVHHRWKRLALIGALALGVGLVGQAQAQDGGGGAAAGEGVAAGSGEGIDIDIKVKPGRELIKVAVPTLEVGGDASKAGSGAFETLNRDLELSGFFKVLPRDSFFFDASKEGLKAESIGFENWGNVGAQALIRGQVKEADDGKVHLDLRLFDVTNQKPITLKWSPGAVKPGEVEGKVHDFVNAVLAHYTGTAGVFGSKIAFVKRDSKKRKQIYLTEVGGTGARAITSNDSINLLPTYGGDGAIYYTSYLKQNPDLWVYRGGKHARLSKRSGQNTGASWCGGKLALTLSMGGENADIYLIDPRSGDIKKRLTDHWAIDTSPTWSGDCSKIAFVSGRSGTPQIYVMNADGSNQRRLTYKGRYNTSPEWSPTEDKVVFTARDERNVFDLFVVDLAGNIERLTQDQGNNEDPSWSPDGRYIAFTSTRGGGKNLWIMSATGAAQQQLPGIGGGVSTPSWGR